MRGRSDYMSNIVSKIILPSPEEDAAISAGIADDPDTFELDQEWFAGAKLTSEVLPHILENRHPTRGKQKSPTKQDTHIRLDPDIIEHFKQGGRGWQTRINDSLREMVEAERTKGTDASTTEDPSTQ